MVVEIQRLPTEFICKWTHKHVFLTGFYDQQQFSDYLRTAKIEFEVHDHDERKNMELLSENPLIEITEEIQITPPPEVQKPKGKGKGGNQPASPPPKKKEENKEENKEDKKRKEPRRNQSTWGV